MTFRPGARLDPGEVRDERGSSGGMGGFGGLGGLGGGGGGIPIPMGGGVVGLIITVVILFILFSGVLNGGGTQSGVHEGAGASGDLASCQTGADANARQDCPIVGYVNSIQAYWQDAFAQHGSTYQPTTTTLFTGFYPDRLRRCQLRRRAVLLPGRQARLPRPRLLRRAADAASAPQGGPLAAGLRRRPRVRPPRAGPARHAEPERRAATPARPSASVRTELQADCYAGVWAAHAVDTGYIEPITQPQVSRRLTRPLPSATTASRQASRAG